MIQSSGGKAKQGLTPMLVNIGILVSIENIEKISKFSSFFRLRGDTRKSLLDTRWHSWTRPRHPRSFLEASWQLSRKVKISWKSRLGARGKPSTCVYRAGWLVEPSIRASKRTPEFNLNPQKDLNHLIEEPAFKSWCRFELHCMNIMKLSRKSRKFSLFFSTSCWCPKLNPGHSRTLPNTSSAS